MNIFFIAAKCYDTYIKWWNNIYIKIQTSGIVLTGFKFSSIDGDYCPLESVIRTFALGHLVGKRIYEFSFKIILLNF